MAAMKGIEENKLREAWDDFTSEKTPTNWIIFELQDDGMLQCAGTGAGGYAEFVTKLDPERVQFSAIKVYAIDRRENVTSMRPKVIDVFWNGPKVKLMKKARAGAQHNDIANSLFRGVTCSIAGSTLDEVSRTVIRDKLLASGGAHKPNFYQFGDGDEIPVGFYNEGTDK